MKRGLALAVTIFATASIAHAPAPSRALRLQLQAGALQGLLEFHLPAAAARLYAPARDPAVALVPVALAGLQIEADGAALQPKVSDASVRPQPDGALDASFLLAIGPALHSLRISADSGAPLPVTLIAQSGVKLSLQDGPGAPIRGGLALRPRPGLPCLISISASEARDTPR